MLYVVTGFMRTGTSMMMKALEAGGLDADYQQSRDEMKNRFADEHYDPNVGGLYELERKDYKKWGFPKKHDGKLIKALNQGVPKMWPMKNGIRVVFMRRDSEEIRQSYDAFFGRQLDPENFLPFSKDQTASYPLPGSNEWTKLDSKMQGIVEKIHNRKDVKSLHEFWFRSVVDNPLKYFQTLKNAGWPIDPKKCAEVVDAKYCRFKLEELEIGVL